MATFRYIKNIGVYGAEHLISAHRMFIRTAFINSTKFTQHLLC